MRRAREGYARPMSGSDEERRIERCLAEDPRTSEMGVRVRIRQHRLHLEGSVASIARSRAAATVVQELTDLEVVDDLVVTAEQPPSPDTSEVV